MTVFAYDAPGQGRRAFLKAMGTTSVAALIPGTAFAKIAAGTDFAEMDATALAAAIRARKLSPLEAVNAAIARAQAVEPKLNILSEELYERARKHALAVDIAVPFGGVPMLIKDEADIAGTAKHFGSKLDKMMPPAAVNDPLVDLMEKSGFNIFGRSTMPEFGILPTTETLAYGITRNPWNLDHVPGGSSGGAAAAVASGVIPVAHGSDGAGSLRIPASNCGLVGLKPSRGRIVGDRPFIDGKRNVGSFLGESFCLSRTVRDTANMLALVEIKGAQAPYQPLRTVTGPPKKRLRIGYIMNGLGGHVPSPEVQESITKTLGLLRSQRHEVSELQWPFPGEAFVEDFTLIYTARAREAKKMLPAGAEIPPAVLRGLVEPASFSMSMMSDEITDEASEAAYARIEGYSKAYFSLFDKIDILVTPVLLKPPVKIGEINGSLPVSVLMQRLNHYGDYTMLQNASGGPAISLPMHWTKDGLPVGVQFAGRLGADYDLLELAFELEAVRPWASRRPPLWSPALV
jgi:amidase